MTLHPQTGDIWWEDCNDLVSMDKSGNSITIQGAQGRTNVSLAITPAGEYYVIAFYERSNPNVPFEHKLFKLDQSNKSWEEVAELTQFYPALTLSTLVSCPDGHIYTVESLDESNLPTRGSDFSAVRRLENDGSFTLIGYSFSTDGSAADCDSTTNRIIFPTIGGIFSVSPP